MCIDLINNMVFYVKYKIGLTRLDNTNIQQQNLYTLKTMYTQGRENI